MNKIICFLNSVYLTARYGFVNWFVYGWSITGHDYESDTDFGDLTCKRCGYTSKGEK